MRWLSFRFVSSLSVQVFIKKAPLFWVALFVFLNTWLQRRLPSGNQDQNDV